MTITFTVAKNKFPDNVTDATTATAIKTWLDALAITTVHSIQMEHVQGFWVIVAIYV